MDATFFFLSDCVQDFRAKLKCKTLYFSTVVTTPERNNYIVKKRIYVYNLIKIISEFYINQVKFALKQRYKSLQVCKPSKNTTVEKKN